MSFILTFQEFDYPFASKFYFKTLEKRKKRRHFLDDLQPLHTNLGFHVTSQALLKSVSAMLVSLHSCPQRPRSFWSAPNITTSGSVQRHSGFEWLCKHNRLRPEPIRFVRLDSEHAQSDRKSVNRGLLVLDSARGRDFWC